MPNQLASATFAISEETLELMVLEKEHLPHELGEFELRREGVLDNVAMADHGFPGNTAEGFSRIGRITGYTREFVRPASDVSSEGVDVAAATVAHLFVDEEAVARWISEVFLGQFEANVGKPVGPGQELVSVERLEVDGFQDAAVGIRAVHDGAAGLLSSTVIDFRLGRLLGVAFVVTTGDHERLHLAQTLAVELERQMVRVVLG